MLFWLARWCHAVALINRDDETEIDGVRAVRVDAPSAIRRMIGALGGADLFTFNNSAEASLIARLDLRGVRAKVPWAGNPIPAEW